MKQQIEQLSNAYPNFGLKKDDQSSGVPYSINNCNLLCDAVNKLILDYFMTEHKLQLKLSVSMAWRKSRKRGVRNPGITRSSVVNITPRLPYPRGEKNSVSMELEAR